MPVRRACPVDGRGYESPGRGAGDRGVGLWGGEVWDLCESLSWDVLGGFANGGRGAGEGKGGNVEGRWMGRWRVNE